MKKRNILKKRLSVFARIRWVRIVFVVLLIVTGVGIGLLIGQQKNKQADIGLQDTIPTNIYEVDLWYPNGAAAGHGSAIQTIGVVQPTQAVTLLAEKSGTIARINVVEGSVVQEGDIVFNLGNSDESLTLAQARESLSQARVALSQAQAEFDNDKGTNTVALENQQDQQVQAAYQALLSSDLRAYAADPLVSRAVNPPIISGTYAGALEGEYKISVYSSASQAGASFLYVGIESGIQTISTSGPVPLGTKGLFISFPGEIQDNVEWAVSIPNTRSVGYTGLINNLKLAQAGKILQEETSEVEIEDIINLQSRVRQAGLAVNAAQVAYARTVVKAPFSGVMTDINIDKGDRVNAQTPLGSLKNIASLEIELEVSKIAAAALSQDDHILKDGKAIADVRYVSPNVTLAGTVRVVGQLFEVQNQGERFQIGQRLEVIVQPSNNVTGTIHDAFTVPVTSLIMRGQEAFVLSVDRFSQTILIPVAITRVNGEWVTLSQPITSAIIKDARGVPDGALVNTTITPTNGIMPPQNQETIVPVVSAQKTQDISQAHGGIQKAQ